MKFALLGLLLSLSAFAGDGTVTNADLVDMPNNRVKGNVSGSTGVTQDLTATELTTLINTFTSGLKGAVPASGGGTTNFLRADGTFATPVGTPSPLTTKGDRYTYDTGNARIATGSGAPGPHCGGSVRGVGAARATAHSGEVRLRPANYVRLSSLIKELCQCRPWT